MKYLIIFFVGCFNLSLGATRADSLRTITVHIIHGSKAAKGQKQEYKTIGGRFGGHIVIEINNYLYGFYYKSRKIHVFPRQKAKNRRGVLEKRTMQDWAKNKKDYKLTRIEIPVDTLQYNALLLTLEEYHKQAPYDYAFFGMRCASSSYYTLSKIGVLQPLTKTQAIVRAFYPAQFRKKMIKLAQENNYPIYIQKGKTTRKWEGDK